MFGNKGLLILMVLCFSTRAALLTSTLLHVQDFPVVLSIQLLQLSDSIMLRSLLILKNCTTSESVKDFELIDLLVQCIYDTASQYVSIQPVWKCSWLPQKFGVIVQHWYHIQRDIDKCSNYMKFWMYRKPNILPLPMKYWLPFVPVT